MSIGPTTNEREKLEAATRDLASELGICLKALGTMGSPAMDQIKNDPRALLAFYKLVKQKTQSK